MKIKIAINGYGRIGRNVTRAIYESGYNDRVQLVAINDLAPVESNAHLTRFDTIHGRFNTEVAVEGEDLLIGGDRIRVCQEREPAKLPWAELGVDLVLECTGRFTDKASASEHIAAGAKAVLISAPSKDADLTVVYGVNHDKLTPDHKVVSNASCTTNCLAPVAKALHRELGIERGFMTTVHAYTNDQNTQDAVHKDIYRARAAADNMIPTKTGAAAAVGLVLPELKGRLDGMAVRVPVNNVSLVDCQFIAGRETSVEEVNRIMKAAAEASGGVLTYCDQPLVSVDFNHTNASSHFDANHTRVNGNLVKVMAWYDNEWGFSHRMLDTSLAMAESLQLNQVAAETA
ncbi:type I glyceraldehyde-3-phosphate dehydrogenase [Microbulbifer thermotolerans]|uniref:Glyceraldehyde-3-phosphate dehydrogenase n=1 Tax=Microbulbifer thermotolerans TaxID=252514 RepID=A0AB35HUU1_MICTH|nr:type I glyceraldehyde-3-phosphate dehydrogenase [Microbulbifer thermotolerans]MCX2780557.1 type I glyceraldehyde-3-phosphate dehydrogenase [Microbulbifer thermotolerans]MCX2783146.1 type I glyceraldehyde-3-phosphate dehydrogenase [Microbulbifer thermotolerans]MCX2794252.1 type I glyceraldehyde-3-phosphate dehydrogenase [Microbulbifer thermotolerans]MCX2800726.1 type I glyceraldehyde-3-phosphate dehydrogenase [Microbulbifer thermotolerans]MCX2803513.1 type I glyceraldehyde-3-phosphate dehydr